MDELWMQIPDFPNYSVSSEGRIRNDKLRKPMRLSSTRHGVIKVGLMDSDGKQITRSVKVLVAEAFVEGREELFATPMQLDGDPTNNRASNIVWRPRWFCLKYARQFEEMKKYKGRGPLVDRNTGVVYKDIVEAALINGLLFYEVELALVNKVPVFPTWHLFDWVKS